MSQFPSIRSLYNLLRRDAPEAAIGVGAVGVSILLLTASWLTRAGGTPELIFHWSGAAFMVVGIGGFVVAIYRARAR
jgi:hypothetical protein